MKCIEVEGNSVILDGGSMFGNAPRELWKRWFEPDEQNRIKLSSRCLLLQLDSGKNILFESGTGCCYDDSFRNRFGIAQEHSLLQNLSKIGLKPDDIDVIVMSHLHFDHAGGLLTEFNQEPLKLAFPKAQYYISEDHWVRATKPHMRDQASFIAVLPKLLEDSGRLHIIKHEQKTLPNLGFDNWLFYSSGHTPGLMITGIELDNGPLAYVADLIPGMPWMHLPITMGFDRYPEKLVNEKKELLEVLLTLNGKVFFTHDPKVACAKVVKDEKGKFTGAPFNL